MAKYKANTIKYHASIMGVLSFTITSLLTSTIYAGNISTTKGLSINPYVLGDALSLMAPKTPLNFQGEYIWANQSKLNDGLLLLDINSLTKPVIAVGERIKVRPDNIQLFCTDNSNPDMIPDNPAELAVPLTLGPGEYEIIIFNDKTETGCYRGTVVGTYNLENEPNPEKIFNMPNMEIDYDKERIAVTSISKSIGSESLSAQETVLRAYKYVIENISYDYLAEEEIKHGNGFRKRGIDSAFLNGRGICTDYAQILTAVLRDNGVPARVAVGTVSYMNTYHAWVQVYIKNEWVNLDPSAASCNRFNVTKDTMIADIAVNKNNVHTDYVY